jgi:hypothetical protein
MANQGFTKGQKSFGQTLLECIRAILFNSRSRDLFDQRHGKTVWRGDARGQLDHSTPGNDFEDFSDGAGAHVLGTLGKQVRFFLDLMSA